MKRYQIITSIGLLFAAAFPLNAEEAPTAQSKQTAPKSVKITDAKLGSINYGVESLEYWLKKMHPGDTRRAAALERDHRKLAVRFQRIPITATDQYKFVARRIDSIGAKIKAKATQQEQPPSTPTIKTVAQRSKVLVSPEPIQATKPVSAAADNATAKPHRNLYTLLPRIAALEKDVNALADGVPINRASATLDNISKYFKYIPVSKHPDYLSVQSRLQTIDQALSARRPTLNMTSEQMDAFLRNIDETYGNRENVMPSAQRTMLKNRELTAAEVDEFLQKMKSLGEAIDRDAKTLQKIYALTGKGQRWVNWMKTGSIEELKQQVAALTKSIDNEVANTIRDVRGKNQLDPAKSPYAFKGAAREKNLAYYQKTLRTMEQAAKFANGMGIENPWQSRQQELQTLIDSYNKKVVAVKATTKLPKEVGTPELHRIAKETLSRDKYGVGKWSKLIVNSKPRELNRDEIKEFNGDFERVVRRWQEFQVTTVEPENGKYYLYYNNIAKFSRAPRTTPVNVWILKKRLKGSEINANQLQ